MEFRDATEADRQRFPGAPSIAVWKISYWPYTIGKYSAEDIERLIIEALEIFGVNPGYKSLEPVIAEF
jgi:hypothetical protein